MNFPWATETKLEMLLEMPAFDYRLDVLRAKSNKNQQGLARAGQHQKNFDLQGTSGGGGCGGVVIIV